MTDRYRVDRSFGGGYTVRKTDIIDDGIVGAAGVAGSLIGASISGLMTVARNSQDRKTIAEIEQLMALATSEEFDRLFASANQFVRRHSQQPYGPAFIGIALAGKGQYDEAIAMVSRAAQLGLDPIEATILRASIYEQKGDIAKAIKEYTLLIQNNDTRQEGCMSRAQALMQIGDLDQALTDVNMAISLSPDEFGYCLRGDIHREGGQLLMAVDDYTRALRLHPNWPFVLEKRAEVYEQLGKTDEAQVDRTAVERNAQDQALSEARNFLLYLRSNGVELNIAPNGRDVEYSEAKVKGKTSNTFRRLLDPQRTFEMTQEAINTIERLKPQLLQVLAGD